MTYPNITNKKKRHLAAQTLVNNRVARDSFRKEMNAVVDMTNKILAQAAIYSLESYIRGYRHALELLGE